VSGTNQIELNFNIDDETNELLEKFEKTINPHIDKVILKIDKKKVTFLEHYKELMRL